MSYVGSDKGDHSSLLPSWEEVKKKKKQNQEKGKTILFTSMMNTVLVIGHFCAPMASSNARLPWHRCANPSRETPDYTDHCKRVMRGS